MAMFITFYSFKGGVGRTLALANIATILAKDPAEPCRVLVWDFDLAAPGLQQVFKCRWKEKRQGFVYYVQHYLTTARMDDISEYICPTDIPGIDILPAGAMDQAYAEALEQIQWGDIYEHARGYELIETVKRNINTLPQQYDYVFIDALTGFSDVGGICVQQLPEVVVLLFRLNNQNLSGIKKVYETTSQAELGKPRAIQVVPVISPAW